MRDAELYLSQHGVPKGLAPLTIRYDKPGAVVLMVPSSSSSSSASSGGGAKKPARAAAEAGRGGGGRGTHVIAAGERLSSRCDLFLQAAPVVTWHNLPNANRPHTVLMIDPDAPAPRLETRRHLPGASGPWLHAMWTNCVDGSTVAVMSGVGTTRGGGSGDVATRTRGEAITTAAAPTTTATSPSTIVPYLGPSPPTGNHRYIFVLFEEGEERDEVRLRGSTSRRERWDFRQFLLDNPHLKPKAVNYFCCSRFASERGGVTSD